MLLAGGHHVHHSWQEVGSAARPGEQTGTRATTTEGQSQQQAQGPPLWRGAPKGRRELGCQVVPRPTRTAGNGQVGVERGAGQWECDLQSLVPRGPCSFRPRLSGGLLESSLYQNIPPSHNGQSCLALGASVPPSLSRACLPDGCLL